MINSFAHRKTKERAIIRSYGPEWLILSLAFILRIWLLEVKPPHFDEGVNGWFADQITAFGYYKYDPTNYHGPFYFYLVFLFKILFGRELWALRLPAVIGSVLCIVWMFRFARFFGRRAVLIAAAAMAVSPACVFYGRYSIHESWLVLFMMVYVWGVLGVWRDGTARYLYAAAVGFSGMLVTKETWPISVISVALALGVLFLWEKLVPSKPALPWAQRLWGWRDVVGCSAFIVLAVVVFYSGFFRDFSGIPKFFEAFSAWSHTGFSEVSGHEKRAQQIGWFNYYWGYLMAHYEWPALLGFLACFPLAGRAPAQRRFLAVYALGVLCAYTMIPYKTPWLIISLLWPLFLLFGGAVDDLFRFFRSRKAFLWISALVFLILLSSFVICLRLNFFRATDDREPYVYVQTSPEMRVLTVPILALARQDVRNYGLRGMILLESYYPLPWVLGDFSRIGYFKSEDWPKVVDADFVATPASAAQRVEERMQEPYYKRRFHLRSGMEECMAYFRAVSFHSIFGGSPEFHPPSQMPSTPCPAYR